MFRLSSRCLALAMLLLGGGAAWAAAWDFSSAPRKPRPQRVESVHLCTDQLVLAARSLADQVIEHQRHAH